MAMARVLQMSTLSNKDWMSLIRLSRYSSTYQNLFHHLKDQELDNGENRIYFFSKRIECEITQVMYYCLRMELAPEWYWYEWMTIDEIDRRNELNGMRHRFDNLLQYEIEQTNPTTDED